MPLKSWWIDFDPAREAVLLGEVQRRLDAQLRRDFSRTDDHVAAARTRYDGMLTGLPFTRIALCAHELARFGARGAEPHAVDDVVQAASSICSRFSPVTPRFWIALSK